ncbi:MAG: hypothetical protein Q8P21_01400 [bacterium]|nr:hypothetical protein [bacterium]
MNNVRKFIDKLNKKDKVRILEVIEQIKRGELAHLNLKKLEGKDNVYRVRKGDFRFICEKDSNRSLHVVGIGRKDDNTYNF